MAEKSCKRDHFSGELVGKRVSDHRLEGLLLRRQLQKKLRREDRLLMHEKGEDEERDQWSQMRANFDLWVIHVFGG